MLRVLGAFFTTLLLAAAPAHAAAPAFDLVVLVARDNARPEGVDAVLRGAHGQTRAGIRMNIPAAVSYPLTIPAAATLRFGVTASANAFMVESPDLARPVTVRVVFTDEAGEHELYRRAFDLKERPADRRWFEESIDLAALAGHTGTIRFETSSKAEDKSKITLVYWSTPRIKARQSGPAAPNLLFVTIDCLRADHVGSYGYASPTTPALDKLASEGLLFENAFANAPMTLPSVPQIFTSQLFPSREEPLLTAPISEAGIASAAFVNNAWIPLWLSQGTHADPPGTFDRLVSGEFNARKITEHALAWLDENSGERFALYLHYLDAHTPYRPPAKWVELFADPTYQGPIGSEFRDEKGAASGKYNKSDQKKILALYDAGIRYIDEQLGRVLDELRASGRLDETLVVITADHGEEFWDHGSFFHGQSLYDELLHIPLIVRLPGKNQSSMRVGRLARGIDIAPSILDWMNLPAPPSFTGEKLGRRLNAAPADLIATATQAQFPTRFAIRRGERKIIESLDQEAPLSFALGRDPGERQGAAPQSEEELQLLQELREARRILRERGFQADIRSAGKAPVTLEIQAHPRSGTFLTLDRRGSTGQAVASSDGRRLTATGPAAGFGFRFDRLKDPTNLGRRDLVTIEARGAEGNPLPLEILLGAQAEHPDQNSFDLNAASLKTQAAPACPPPQGGVRLCLWNFPGDKPSALPEIHSPALRERLRALGYIQ
ncbi:MAG: sulfatase [Deltaproteobacteria bacterium]